MLKGLRGMGRHVSICHCSSKEGSNSSHSHMFRVVLWYWDVLAAARTGVTRTGHSGDGIGFEEAMCMQWHGKGSGIQCTLLAPRR